MVCFNPGLFLATVLPVCAASHRTSPPLISFTLLTNFFFSFFLCGASGQLGWVYSPYTCVTILSGPTAPSVFAPTTCICQVFPKPALYLVIGLPCMRPPPILDLLQGNLSLQGRVTVTLPLKALQRSGSSLWFFPMLRSCPAPACFTIRFGLLVLHCVSMFYCLSLSWRVDCLTVQTSNPNPAATLARLLPKKMSLCLSGTNWVKEG